MSATHPEIDLVPFSRGELNAAERDRVQHHLDGCGQCRESIGALAATLQQVSAHLEELPTPEWSAYRRELRLKLARRTETRSRWWRPGVVWASLATASLGIAALILALTMRPVSSPGITPQVDQLAMEQAPETVDVGLLRDYPVVEKLDLLEDYDVIERLDQLPAAQHNHDTRS
jgi:anti-sigma-K factor RskA